MTDVVTQHIIALAHGLFALRHGRFLASEIPSDQLQSASVHRFLSKLKVALGISVSAPPEIAVGSSRGSE